MPRLCTVCTHPKRHAIDAALLKHTTGHRSVAKRFGVDADSSVYRHLTLRLLGSYLAQSKEAKAMLDAQSLRRQDGRAG